MFQLLVVLLSVSLLSNALPAELQLLAEVGSQSRSTLYELSPSTESALAHKQVNGNSMEIADTEKQPENQLETEKVQPGPAASSAVSLKFLTASKQRHVLPAQILPLPITITTRPGLRTVIEPETITLQEHGLAKIGDVVQKIPTSVSHQSHTVVHKHANVLTPIVAPAVRTYSTQILRSYHTPLLLQPIPIVSQE